MTGFGEQRSNRSAEAAGTDYADLQRGALRQPAARGYREGTRRGPGCKREQGTTRKSNSVIFAHVCFPSGWPDAYGSGKVAKHITGSAACQFTLALRYGPHKVHINDTLFRLWLEAGP